MPADSMILPRFANKVCRSWVLDGNRVELWASLGKSFEVTMPVSLGPQAGGRIAVGGKGKRMLRFVPSRELFTPVSPLDLR